MCQRCKIEPAEAVVTYRTASGFASEQLCDDCAAKAERVPTWVKSEDLETLRDRFSLSV